MARYRKIDVRVWTDAKFMALTAPEPNAQTLWFYLLTNPDTTNVPGLYRAGEAGLAEALGWSTEGFRKAFRELSAQGLAKADWKARLVFIPNAIKHNPPENPNVIKGWRVAWDELPECDLKVEAHRTFTEFLKGFAEGFQKAFAEGFAKEFGKSGAGAGAGAGAGEKHLSASADAPVADAAPAPLVLEATDAAPQGPRRSESGESADPSPKPADLQALWNEFAVPAGLPAWDSPTTGQRLAHAKARLAERPAWTLRGPADSWEALLKRIAASDFLAGRANGFRASSGWVLKPENFAKVLEGNYDNREAPALRRQPANAISAAAKAEFANSPKGIQDDF